MINAINNFGGQTQQIRQNPDEYAKFYAEQNGISVEEAKAELKAKYGDPQEQNGMSSIGSFGNFGNVETQDISSIQEEIAGLEEKLFGSEANTSIWSQMMNFFNGGNNSSESNELINPKTGSMTGPQKEGDPQFHLNPTTGTQTGPQKEGDFDFFNKSNSSQMNIFSNNSQNPQMDFERRLNPFFA